MSSAKQRLVIAQPLMLTVLSWSSMGSVKIFSRNMLKLCNYADIISTLFCQKLHIFFCLEFTSLRNALHRRLKTLKMWIQYTTKWKRTFWTTLKMAFFSFFFFLNTTLLLKGSEANYNPQVLIIIIIIMGIYIALSATQNALPLH